MPLLPSPMWTRPAEMADVAEPTGVRLILAHDHDVSARALARRWGSKALLLTVADLRHARWCLELDPDGRVRTELTSPDGRPVRVDGVVNRLGGIMAAHLPRVHLEDRSYAAAELGAFLRAWLDACPAPVLNRPCGESLNGPAWNLEQWAAAAVSVGLRVEDIERHVELATTGAALEPAPAWDDAIGASVVGDTCFGDVHPEVGGRLRALARLAGTALFAATAEGPGPDARVRHFSVWPDLADPAVADAVAALLPDTGGGNDARSPAGEPRRASVAASR